MTCHFNLKKNCKSRRQTRLQNTVSWTLFLQQFNNNWSLSGCNHWKRKFFAKTCLKNGKNLFPGGFRLLKPLCDGLSCMPPLDLEYIVVVCSTEFAYSVGVVDGRHTMVDIVKFGLVQNILLPCGASIELTLGLKEKLVSVFQFVVFKFQILE